LFDSDNSNDVQIKRLTNFFFRFFVFSPPSKPPPMNRHRTYCQMNPLTGIWPAYGNALGYRYVSPDGDGQSFTITTTPPRCDDTTTTLHSPFSILNSQFFILSHLLRKGTRRGNRPILLWFKILFLRFEHLAERRSDE